MGLLDYHIGLVGLLHPGYAGWIITQQREALKILDEDLETTPPEVLLLLALGMIICTFAGVRVFGSFLPIKLDVEGNRMMELPAALDFMAFNHRGRVLPLSLKKGTSWEVMLRRQRGEEWKSYHHLNPKL
eukprot:TRINITY_DN10929_c0_g1_i1.p1 TRINITY_DN10929_c0_g1~~TRINITY_DN10929_c0_g1_i1.p1  ORF type:complete len:130 (-),score=17.40 TRINITY_DN10929_c0_g1_i1:440-829(-)